MHRINRTCWTDRDDIVVCEEAAKDVGRDGGYAKEV